MTTPAPESGSGDRAITVRVLEIDQWQSYRDLRIEMLRDAPDFFWSTSADVAEYTEFDWKCEVAGPRTHLQALEGSTPVAALSIDWIGYGPDMMLDETTVNIVSVYVRPSHRGRGVTALLLARADDLMREAGRSRQLLETPEDNVAARRAYEKLGFQETGRRSPDPRRAHLNEVEYQRVISPS